MMVWQRHTTPRASLGWSQRAYGRRKSLAPWPSPKPAARHQGHKLVSGSLFHRALIRRSHTARREKRRPTQAIPSVSPLSSPAMASPNTRGMRRSGRHLFSFQHGTPGWCRFPGSHGSETKRWHRLWVFSPRPTLLGLVIGWSCFTPQPLISQGCWRARHKDGGAQASAVAP